MTPPTDAPDGPTDRHLEVLSLSKGLARGGVESLLLVGFRHRDRTRFSHRAAYVSGAHRDLVEEIEAEDVEVTCLGSGRSRDLRWLVHLRRLLREVDVVHAHSPIPAVAARLVRRTIPRRRRPALVTTEHNVWESHHRLTRAAERLTFSLDDAHLAVSHAVRASLPPSKGAQVEVVVQGVDLDALVAATDRDGARRELGVGDDEVLIGTVANLRPQKGYHDLLTAARTVLDQTPRARFVAIGQGPQEAEVAELHEQLGLGDRFVLLGHRADAVRLMSGFDVFCLASHYEGLPVALMEALALGIPVVATRAGGIHELVTDGTEGRLVPPGHPDLLAAALVEGAADEAVRATWSKCAAERGTTLSILRSVRRHEDLYRDLTGSVEGR